MCIDGRRYVCCAVRYAVSNECVEPNPSSVQPIGTHGGEVTSFVIFGLVVSLGSSILMMSACVS